MTIRKNAIEPRSSPTFSRPLPCFLSRWRYPDTGQFVGCSYVEIKSSRFRSGRVNRKISDCCAVICFLNGRIVPPDCSPSSKAFAWRVVRAGRSSTPIAAGSSRLSAKPEAVIPRACGVSSTLRLIDFITGVSGILDRPPSRTMTVEYDFVISRRIAPEVCISFALSEIRGRREDRVLAAPAVSRAICANKNCTRAYRAAGTLRPSLRNGFTAYFVLSPENGSFASVVGGKLLPANVMPAPRHQNHTTSPYASGAYVYRAICVHRIPPRVRDVRERPSHRVRRAELCG